jgi:DoxX.
VEIRANSPSRRSGLAEASASRLFWLKTTVILAFCTGLWMSGALWIGPRSYPLTPLSSLFPVIGDTVALVLYVALFVLAGIALVAPKPGWPIAAFLAVMAAFCLMDQTRWQPWVFQCSFLLAAIALNSGNGADADGDKRALNIARLIVAFTYVYSGLQKLNLNFMENDFPWLVQPITNPFPSTAHVLHGLGMAAPFIQVAFGIGLLTRRFRRASLIAAVAMHLFILAMFGPAGLDWNNVVWSWTAAMAVFDVLLFAGAEFSWREIVWSGRDPFHLAAIVMFAVLPALSFFNLWDSYLSSALYSGNLTEAQIYLSDAGKASLPAAIALRAVHTSPDTNVVNLQRWAIEDLNVTPYPETRVYKAIARSVCAKLHDQSQLVLMVREQRMFFSRPETGFRCFEL